MAKTQAYVMRHEARRWRAMAAKKSSRSGAVHGTQPRSSACILRAAAGPIVLARAASRSNRGPAAICGELMAVSLSAHVGQLVVRMSWIVVLRHEAGRAAGQTKFNRKAYGFALAHRPAAMLNVGQTSRAVPLRVRKGAHDDLCALLLARHPGPR
jgi:hypothetical protein